MEQHHHHHHAMMAMQTPEADPMSMDTSASSSSSGVGGSGGGGGNGMHMHMTFYWGPDVTILFSSWTTAGWAQYSFALILCFAATVAYEALAAYRAKIVSRVRAAAKQRSSGRPARPASESVATSLLDAGPASSVPSADKMMLSMLFGAGSALGYLLMLVVMSFNMGVFLAVCAGHAVGVYWFGLPRVLSDEPQLETGCHS